MNEESKVYCCLRNDFFLSFFSGLHYVSTYTPNINELKGTQD